MTKTFKQILNEIRSLEHATKILKRFANHPKNRRADWDIEGGDYDGGERRPEELAQMKNAIKRPEPGNHMPDYDEETRHNKKPGHFPHYGIHSAALDGHLPIEDVPLHKIRSKQWTVAPGVVHSKMQGKWSRDSGKKPAYDEGATKHPIFAHNPLTDTYHLTGYGGGHNHNIIAQRILQGRKGSIKGFVHHPKTNRELASIEQNEKNNSNQNVFHSGINSRDQADANRKDRFPHSKSGWNPEVLRTNSPLALKK